MSRPFNFGPSPVGWKSTKLRTILTRTKRLNHSELPLLSVNLPVGVVPRQDNDGRTAPSVDLSGYQLVEPGDLVMNQLGKPHGALGVSSIRGIISPAYFVATIAPSADPRFIHHLLRTRLYISEYERRGKNMPPNQFDIGWDQFREIEIMLPPLSEQRAIADYLDTETARIDALVARKLRLSDLLEARRIASLWSILSSACPNPTRVKSLVTKVGSGSTPRGGSDVYVDAGVAFLRSQNIRDGRVFHDDVVYITEEEDAAMSSTRVKSGDVLLNITGGSIGRTAVASASDLPANVSQHVCILRPIPQIASQVLQAALDTKFVQDQISLVQVGGNREGLNFDQIRRLEVHVPQTNSFELVRRLDDVNVKHRRASSKIQLQITLLRQRRQSIITAAVTGELEISEVAA